jgi:hypothetical protein
LSKETVLAIFEALLRNLPGGVKEIHENIRIVDVLA